MTTSTLQPGDVLPELGCDNAQLVAARSVEVWEALARTLVPLIGEKGFATLFARCVHLTRGAHPWLALERGGQGAAAFAGLGPLLAGRGGADALAASRALLLTFHDALTVLIGAPLANAMLGAMRGRDTPPTEDIPS